VATLIIGHHIGRDAGAGQEVGVAFIVKFVLGLTGTDADIWAGIVATPLRKQQWAKDSGQSQSHPSGLQIQLFHIKYSK
jgi:hypothetical protein